MISQARRRAQAGRRERTVSDDDKDAIARLIAAAIYRPQPHMSGDIFQRLGALRERGCRDAAEAVAEYLKQRN